MLEAWAASGAMALTGRPHERGLGPPAPLVDQAQRLASDLHRASHRMGTPVAVDPLELLTQRAALAGLGRQGSRSCGGATRLLASADGWLALSLARPSDHELVPAWLERDAPLDGEGWDSIAEVVSHRPGRPLVERAALLGLAAASVGEPQADPVDPTRSPDGVRRVRLDGVAPGSGSLVGCRVVDLSSLWAGPLCGALLARAGAEVIKVESTRRPDGSRSGPAQFFDLLNAGKRSVALDFTDPDGVSWLHRLVDDADVVIEASRPRALAGLGLDPHRLGPRLRVWVSITGHGRRPGQANRVGFGDDAAAAGGLVVWSRGRPLFCADAIADPLAGLAAAAAASQALAIGGRWLLDVALASVARTCAGPTLAVPDELEAAPPQRPGPTPAGPRLGADNHDVLGALGGHR